MRCASGIVALLLLVSTISCSAINAQNNYRIQRGALSEEADDSASDQQIPAPSIGPGGAQMAPLRGAIEHRTTWVDPSQFQAPMQTMTGRASQMPMQPMSGQANQTQPMSGQASLTPMQASTDRSQFRAGIANQGPLSAGASDRGARLRSQTGRTDMPAMQPFALNTARTRLPGDISDPELNMLRSKDIVIMQDRSSSMAEHENFPQGYFPRWYWCLNQAMDFKRQTSRLPNWMFTLVLFSSKFDIYRNVTMEQLPAAFDRSHIWIGTKLAEPMAEQLNEYFQRRQQGHARPLLIVVVTDGKPKDENDLAQIIIDATHQIQSPREVHITFLQVGTDDESMRKLSKLDSGLSSRGARFDIVSVMPFDQVTRLGLSKALVQAVRESNR